MQCLRRLFFFSLSLGWVMSPLWAQNFQILKAEYGAGMNWTDVTDRVQALVRGNGVELTVDGNTLGDPMPGVQKTLRIRYSFRNRVRTENFRDLDNVRLGNPSAGGGGFPGGGGPGFGRGLQIESARYGVGNRWSDVTALLNNSIQNDALRMQVTNATMGGDPAPANEKVLEVRYRYQGQSQSVTIRENQQLELGGSGSGSGPGFGGQGLRILTARYGDGFRTTDVTQFLINNISNNSLRVQVNTGSMGGDPAPGIVKTLVVQYEYNGARNSVNVRDGEMLQLPEGFGGGNGGGWGGNRLEILEARYGTFGRNVDVTEIVRGAIRNNGIRLTVSDFTMKANPSGSRNDRLTVRYVYNGQQMAKDLGERETLVLP